MVALTRGSKEVLNWAVSNGDNGSGEWPPRSAGFPIGKSRDSASLNVAFGLKSSSYSKLAFRGVFGNNFEELEEELRVGGFSIVWLLNGWQKLF